MGIEYHIGTAISSLFVRRVPCYKKPALCCGRGLRVFEVNRSEQFLRGLFLPGGLFLLEPAAEISAMK